MEGGGWELAGNAAAAGDDSIAVSSYLDFLSDDLLGPGGLAGALPQMPALMDPSTLAAAAAAGAIAQEQQQRKRVKREPSQLEAAAGDNGSNDDVDLDGLSDDDEDLLSGGTAGRKGASGSKRKTPAAAQNKASREKARREKINDRFSELAKLVDPCNEPKTDKLSILSESIRYVQQTQLENSQLKQLNKFLEEKVGQLEKERGQLMFQMYQYSAMQPAAAAAAVAGGPAGCAGAAAAAAAAAAAGMMAPNPAMMMPGMPLQAVAMQPMMQQQAPQQQQAQLMMGLQPQQQQAQMQAAGPSSVNLQQQPEQQPQMQPSQQLVQQEPQQLQQGDAAQQMQQVSQQMQAPGMLLPAGAAAAAAAQQGMMPQHMACKPMLGAPPMPQGMMVPYWPSMMPQSMLDSTQDSLLRPPAA